MKERRGAPLLGLAKSIYYTLRSIAPAYLITERASDPRIATYCVCP